jgi:ATP-dependent exoDNAse (exonuclease V) beta subunit
MPQTSNFTIYNASAGSGKTFTLAQRYLILLLSSSKYTHFQNILAITFTNKAVAEMKSRILDYLTLFSQENEMLESDDMFLIVKEQTGLTSAQIQKKSYGILKEILNNYAAFEVSTIDAFTHRIIRTFAKDLGLSMTFDIEMDTPQVLELAVERVVQKAGSDEVLTEVLIDFALEKANEDKSSNISQDILVASNLLLNEKDEAYLNALEAFDLKDFKSFKTRLDGDIKSMTKKLQDIGHEFLQQMNNAGLEAKDFTRRSIPNYFKKLCQDNSLIAFGAAWQNSIEDEETYVTKKQTEDKRQLIFSMRDFIVERFYISKKLYTDKIFFQKIRQNITQLSLLSAVSHEMELIKKEQNIMLISDFNKKISKEIKKQPAPFIFERLGEKFQHYFIDEFQDTSRMQWENLIPLTGNALASLFEGDTQGTLTLVGDAKQSIYAWRGGDAKQFMDLYGGKSPFPIQPHVKNLGTNFRSSRAIVNFNNDFFEYVGSQLDDEVLKELFSGDQLIQTPHKSSEGFVNLKFIEAENKEERSEIYPQEVLDIIQKKQAQGYELSDICILVRGKQEGVAIAKVLNEHNVPIISSETLLINSDENVQLILNVLQVLNDEYNDICKAEVLENLVSRLGYSEERKYNILSKTLRKDKHLFWETLKELGYALQPSHFHTLPFYDAIEYLINQLELNQNGNAYLQFFLDEVFDFSQKHEGNLSSFLQYWSLQGDKKSIVSTASENAVQIMTVHKSKGLQFPIVIFPYAKVKIDNALYNHLWVDLPDELEIPHGIIFKPSKSLDHPLYNEEYLSLIHNLKMENINILYVALTRAAKELYIISEDDRAKDKVIKPNTFAGLLMGFLEQSKQLSVDVNMDYSWGESKPPEQELTPKTEVENKALKFHSPSKDLNLSLVTTAGKFWNTELEEALNEGNLIHSILANIQYKEDIPNAVSQHIDDGFIEQEKEKYYIDLLNTLSSHKDLEAFFTEDYEVWTERDLYHEGQVLRPDRVNLKGKEAYLIDYKTGVASSKHIQQIEDYTQALRSLEFNVKKRLLVYIGNTIEVKNV